MIVVAHKNAKTLSICSRHLFECGAREVSARALVDEQRFYAFRHGAVCRHRRSAFGHSVPVAQTIVIAFAIEAITSRSVSRLTQVCTLFVASYVLRSSSLLNTSLYLFDTCVGASLQRSRIEKTWNNREAVQVV